jgi:Abnormal spindle-like microcephaly-assoc'd, ASPM-SPD-2-Hydin
MLLLPREACNSAHLRVFRLALLALAVSLGYAVASAQVTANPSQLNFGDVQVGSKSTLPTVLTNTGTSTVSITSGQIQGTGFLPNAKLPITLTPGQQYTLNVTFTPRGNGPFAGTLTGSNSSGPIVSVPVAGNGTQAGYSVNLTWDPSQSPPEIVGYNVYRATQNGGPYLKMNSALDAQTSYIDYTVLTGTTYYYVTTAVDSAGQQSPYSNQTEAVIP